MSEIIRNGLPNIIAQAIQDMEAELGKKIPLEELNLSELERKTGLSRGKLRWWKKKELEKLSNTAFLSARISIIDKFEPYQSLMRSLLTQGISNSSVCFQRMQNIGFAGSLATVKRYIADHRFLIPAKRTAVTVQGNRGRRYSTGPGEAFQMDWGFTKVLDPFGNEYRAACFAMVCHHCGRCYIEFFPNAKQENLFIGMIHAFMYMGIPEYVLTDNMKSVVISRDFEGHPIWQKDYESFMKTVGFRTKLCRPRHPFTKGKVERLVRYVKDNFLVGRHFMNVTDLNISALEWCETNNNSYRKFLNDIPSEVHFSACANNLAQLILSEPINEFLCPVRKISFDGFVNYEGIRFGVPYTYNGQYARVRRKGDRIYIYSYDMKHILTTHPVTWDRRDQFCVGQYEDITQPEEFPTAPIKTTIRQIPNNSTGISFESFDFNMDCEDNRDE